jgi:hypothetical protein
MQSNTVAVQNSQINFAGLSVENQRGKFDPFTVRDGRYVGNDGFVVPRDFEEFYERFPDYVRKWVGKHADWFGSKEDLEDWTQDLIIHLYRLPQTSKYREAGKKDIVETFDPMKHYGANEARFRNYINLCLANKFRTMHSKRIRDALGCPRKLSLDGETEGENLHSVNSGNCHANSAHLKGIVDVAETRACDEAFLREFANFLRRKDPRALSTMGALLATRTQAEAAVLLGATEYEFVRMRIRLGELGRCFLTGQPVPKQRRPYKRRASTEFKQLARTGAPATGNHARFGQGLAR